MYQSNKVVIWLGAITLAVVTLFPPLVILREVFVFGEGIETKIQAGQPGYPHGGTKASTAYREVGRLGHTSLTALGSKPRISDIPSDSKEQTFVAIDLRTLLTEYAFIMSLCVLVIVKRMFSPGFRADLKQ